VELVFEVNADMIKDARKLVMDAMQSPIEGFDVPLIAESDIARVWSEKTGLEEDSVSLKKSHILDVEFLRRLNMAGLTLKTKLTETDLQDSTILQAVNDYNIKYKVVDK
jgi:hypothetical protein